MSFPKAIATCSSAKVSSRINKIAVTGVPNLDNLEAYRQNDFPLKGYVLSLPQALARLSNEMTASPFYDACARSLQDDQFW